MTTVPLPRQPSPSFERTEDGPLREESPVAVLKELVARLQREQNKIQDLLSSLGYALRSFRNLNQFLELIPLMATRVTDADGGVLVLFQTNGPNGQMRLERWHCPNTVECQHIRRSLETAARQLSVPFSPTAPLAPAINRLEHQMNGWLGPGTQLFGTAIVVKNRERGRLYVFSLDPDYSWTRTRQKLVRLVADQTAVAIENDELTVELRKKERMDRELEIGAEIQLQLLPRQCPKIEGVQLAARCETANRVGGDYYDFVPANYDRVPLKKGGNERGKWSIAIGDVMGKGVPAGLIMTMLRGMLRAEVLNGHTPDRILQHLNHVMYTDLENSNRFVTLFYSEYDPLTRRLFYSNAAHNPPMLWRSATDEILRLDTLGMLVGLDVNTQYETGEIQLDPGDVVIFYTDGFTDAANQNGERFDEENLLVAFREACHRYQNPQAILEVLFSRVKQFIGPSSRNADDMTLVVMKVNEATASQPNAPTPLPPR